MSYHLAANSGTFISQNVNMHFVDLDAIINKYSQIVVLVCVMFLHIIMKFHGKL